MRTHEQPHRMHLLLLSVLVLQLLASIAPAAAQDRIRGPSFAPWIRRTADLTNMIVAEKTPRRFRCAYRKRAKTSTESPAEDLPPFPSAAANDAPDLKITMHEQSKRHEKEHHHRRHHHKNRATAD
ncbi:hypothetical protein M3Y99_00159000 [Aphelenchoides fujianensis]|nr:hypothetical protein M3Y99_00159000 [Aphelenchoides fujianensis]